MLSYDISLTPIKKNTELVKILALSRRLYNNWYTFNTGGFYPKCTNGTAEIFIIFCCVKDKKFLFNHNERR